MIRTDGKYQIYRIEQQWEGSEKWSDSNENEIEFPASSECWQLTGVHGTFDLKVAKEAFERVVSKPDENRRFRLVLVTIDQAKKEIQTQPLNSSQEPPIK